MKKIKYIMLLIFILLVAGCSSSEDEGVEPLEKVERDVNPSEDQGYQEVEIADNTEEELSQAETETSMDQDGSDPVDLSDGQEGAMDEKKVSAVDEKSERDEESEGDEVLVNRPSEEFRVLDTEEPEDLTDYTSSLVFIRKEEDLWRVVDRLGKVYRVTTSNDKAVPGMVNNGASIQVDEEGQSSVSLIRDYTYYDSPMIIDSAKELAADTFAKDLLNRQKVSEEGQISSYVIHSVTEEAVGKGILNVTLNFDVEPSRSGVWGMGKEITYHFTIYGYEDRWILPVQEPLYNQLNPSGSNMEAVDLDSQWDTEDQGTEDQGTEDQVAEDQGTEDQGTEDQGTEEEKSEDDEQGANLDLPGFQKVLAIIDGKTLYLEKEKLTEIIGADGKDLTEHRVYLNIAENDAVTSIQKGELNGNYEWVLNYESKVLLINLVQPPSADTETTGLSMVDMTDNTYRTLYKGSLMKGAQIDHKYYVFSESQLLEVNLKNKSLRIVGDLGFSIDTSTATIQVLQAAGSNMTFSVKEGDRAVTYGVNISTGQVVKQ